MGRDKYLWGNLGYGVTKFEKHCATVYMYYPELQTIQYKMCVSMQFEENLAFEIGVLFVDK